MLNLASFTLKGPIFDKRTKGLQIIILLPFGIVGRVRNHGKMFPNLSQTSFGGIVQQKWRFRVYYLK